MRSATERHLDELKDAGEQLSPDGIEMLASTKGPLSSLEAIRELNALYGIAVSKIYTAPRRTLEQYGYRNLARDIHYTLEAIAFMAADPEAEIDSLASQLESKAPDCNDTTRCLYETWAKHLRGIG